VKLRPHRPATPASLPRRKLRTQLTLLYAVPFFASGFALLSVPIAQVSRSATVPVGNGKLGDPNAPGSLVGPSGTGSQGLNSSSGTDLGQLLTVSALGLVVMVLISFLLGWLIAGRFLRPLRMITATARDISANNLHRRLSLNGRDEFTELAETLDDLFERLEASFESQRHFVANASHELRTPLTAERTLLQVALADPGATEDTLRSACEDVLALGESQERLIEALLTLATSERGIERTEAFDLAEITGDVVLARSQEAHRRGLQIDMTLTSAPTVGDPSLVESLTANLLDNALRHNTAGGRIEVTTATIAGRAHLMVRNTGPVIPPDQLDRLFQPFQQLGGQRIRLTGGHGIGLAIVRAIADAHGATLARHARPDGGLDIEVSFPGAGLPRLTS
jgi:signal transduction histidine kinase